MTYQDNMHLEDIETNDLEMTRDAVKNAKRYCFPTSGHAMSFVGACVKATLEKLGVKNFLKMNDKMLKMIQKERNIKVEHRTQYHNNDIWRCGLYIYKDDVLVVFISEVLVPVRHPLLIKQKETYDVITNATPDTTRRVYA